MRMVSASIPAYIQHRFPAWHGLTITRIVSSIISAFEPPVPLLAPSSTKFQPSHSMRRTQKDFEYLVPGAAQRFTPTCPFSAY
jgi:hypothetical protein